MGAFAGPDISESGLVLALDAANKKSYSQNEFQYSTDIFGWFSGNSGGVTAAIVSRDTISSPIGNTPLKMEVTGNDPHLGSYNAAKWNIAPAANGQTWIVSVYAKANVATTGEILIFGANSSGAAFVNGGWVSLTGTTVSIGTEWTRVQHIHTMNSVDVAFIHTRLDGPNSGGTGQTVWWDGLQVERVPAGTTTPTPFTSSYYGGSVYRDLVGSNNGTLVNYPTYSGSNSGSLVFDGTNDYITSSFATTSGQAVTYCGWLYSTETTAIYRNFVDSVPARPMIWWNTSGQIEFDASFYTTPAVYRNQWVYVALSKPSGSSSASYYVNGVLVGSGTAYTTPAVTPTWFNRAAGQTWRGNCSVIQAYNRALSAQEIQQNFNATRSRFGI
jgi:hypothetical protein